MDSSNKLVDLIRDISKESTSSIDKAAICYVDSINTDGTLNIRLPSDIDNIIRNIPNNSAYLFQSGDYAVLYKIENKLNNSFVISKITRTPPDIQRSNIISNSDILISPGTSSDNGTSVYINNVKKNRIDFTSDPQTQINNKLNFNGNGSDVTVDFTESTNDPIQNIDSGSNLSELFGITKQWLAALKPVALSGSYNDLTDTPIIPDVNNGKLTINQNSIKKGDFTANQSSDTTINILTPTKTSDLINDGDGTSDFATESFVNSSISTNTATFRGTYNIVTDLNLTTSATESQIATALAEKMTSLSITPTNNDYTFVSYPDATDPTQFTKYDRYKYDSTQALWAYEYTLNNSSFTAAQWGAINSGITSSDVSQITTNKNDISGIKDGVTINSFSGVESALSGKQDTLTFDNIPTKNSNNPVKSGGVYNATFSRVYRGIAEVSNSLTSSSTMIDLINAMANNSVLVCQPGSYTGLIPSNADNRGVLEVYRADNENCANARYTVGSTTDSKMWYGEYHTASSINYWTWREVANVNNLSNPNLLYNGDFTVNTSGIISFPCSNVPAYTRVVVADGWLFVPQSTNSTAIVTRNTDYLTVYCQDRYDNLTQYITNFSKLAGKNLTCTFSIKSVSGTFVGRIIADNAQKAYVDLQSGLNTFTVTLPNSITSELKIQIYNNANGSGTVEPYWVKLELGDIATEFIPPIYELEEGAIAANKPSTTQSTSAITIPSNKLLKESTFARVYRTFYDDLGITLSSSTTMAQVCGAMVDYSEAYLQKTSAGGVDIATKFPTATNGTLHILRWNSTRTSLEYFPADNSVIKYIGYYNTNLSPAFTGWKQVANVENLSNSNLIFNSDLRINTKGLQIYGSSTETAHYPTSIETVNGWWFSRDYNGTFNVSTKTLTVGSNNGTYAILLGNTEMPITLLEGKTLTISVNVVNDGTNNAYLDIGYGTPNSTNYIQLNPRISSKESGLMTTTVTIPSGLSSTNVLKVRLYKNAGFVQIVDGFHLELGNIVTEYTPPVYEIEQWGAANLSDLAKPNLLYNGDFVINTRGQPQYSISSNGPIETVDGFLLYYYSSPTLAIKSGGGVSISGTATGDNNFICRHNVLNYTNLAGKTVTLTIKLSNITGTGLKVRTSSTSSGTYSSAITSDIIFTNTFNVNSNPTELAITLTTASSGAYSFDVDWWKLELGDISTEFTPTTIPIEQGALYAYNNAINITGLTVDLNDLNFSSGYPYCRRYICKTTGGSSNISNKPTGDAAFILDVDLIRYNTTSDYVVRQTYAYVSNIDIVYVRTCTNGTWGNWYVSPYRRIVPICASSGGSINKTVPQPAYTAQEGNLISVYFLSANTAANATLNINNTGPYSIYVNGSAATGASGNLPAGWHTFYFDGSRYLTGTHSLPTESVNVVAWTDVNTTFPLSSASASDSKILSEKAVYTETVALEDKISKCAHLNSSWTQIKTWNQAFTSGFTLGIGTYEFYVNCPMYSANGYAWQYGTMTVWDLNLAYDVLSTRFNLFHTAAYDIFICRDTSGKLSIVDKYGTNNDGQSIMVYYRKL